MQLNPNTNKWEYTSKTEYVPTEFTQTLDKKPAAHAATPVELPPTENTNALTPYSKATDLVTTGRDTKSIWLLLQNTQIVMVRYMVQLNHLYYLLDHQRIYLRLKEHNYLNVCLKCVRSKDNPILAYRNYYIVEKNSFASWKNRSKPEWYIRRKIL